MLRSNPSVVERLYSRTGREHRAVLFSSCPAGSPKAINLLECQPADTLIGTSKYTSINMFTLHTFAETIGLAE